MSFSRRRLIRFMVIATGVLVESVSPWAAPKTKCTADRTLCLNDVAFAYQEQSGELVYGKIKDIDSNGQITFQPNQGSVFGIAAKDVASTHPSTCTPVKLCPGDGAQRKSAENSAVVLGVFSTGYVVIQESGGKPVSVKSDTLSKSDAKNDQKALKELLKKLAEVPGVIDRSTAGGAANCGSSNVPAKDQGPLPSESSLKRVSSFASMLLHPPLDQQISAALGASCANAIKNVYASGKTLYSASLHKAATKVLAWGYDTPKKSPAEFYHWTHSADMPGIVKSGSFDEVFKYLRTQSLAHESGSGLWYGQWYVAEDPNSSSRYGNVSVTVSFSSDALVISRVNPAWNDAIAEIEKKYPDIGTNCKFIDPQQSDLFGAWENSPLFLIGEDSGIDLIDYYTDGSKHWFQMLSPAHLSGYKPE